MMEWSTAEWIAVERTLLLLGPTALAIMLLLVLKPTAREAAATMVCFLWQVPALLLLHWLATGFGWWSFASVSRQLEGLPIDVWIGWAIWWGVVPALALRVVGIIPLVLLAVILDIASMPLLSPLVVLSPAWLLGEVVAVFLCLLPGLCIAILTRDDRRAVLRAVFHVLGWGGYLVLVIPAAVLAYEGRDYLEFLRMPASAADWLLAAAASFLLFVGIAATAEFAVVGEGTPIPLDPPKRVVTTGPYAFIANPMQIISALVMLCFAAYAGSLGLLAIAISFVVFDAIYASWYNSAHIAHAMPRSWRRFSDEVPGWGFRWRPFVEGEAEVVISRDGPARWGWERVWRHAYGRSIVRERDLEPQDGLRLRYRRPAASIDAYGVVAAARVLEHGPLPLAVLGWLLRFPGIGAVLQLIAGLLISWYRRAR